MGKNYYTLPLPKLMDMTQEKNIGYIKIKNTTHKFSPNAKPSGNSAKDIPSSGCNNNCSNPIFGSKYYITSTDNNIKHKTIKTNLTFGLPFFKFKKGIAVDLYFKNKTGYSFDLHWHGLNTLTNVDGASSETEFGVDTKIGTNFHLKIPKITNNSALLWVHAHPMFIASSFVYGGIYGLVDIVDDISENINKSFKYGNNHIALVYEDMEFNSDGTINSQNLYTDAERSCFGLMNGISCVNWYSNKPSEYVINLCHSTNKELVKIDILNGTCSFRNIFIGVCDKNNKIKSFYYIQTDTGYRNPTLLEMLQISPANRVSILVDLNEFENKKAYVFLYNFDLTEVFNIELNEETQTLIAGVPDLNLSSNPTPNPTPIPDPNSTNIDGNPTNLKYPVVPAVPQIVELIPHGAQVAPQISHKPYSIKKFLKIKLCNDSNSNDSDSDNCHSNDLQTTIKNIRKLVFGDENYHFFKKIINKNNFEYDNHPQINYISLLNNKYFYNLPDIHHAPARNFIFFPDDDENAQTNSNPYGATEYINGANRIIVDLWNEEELDLSYAMTQYNLSPNNYVPNILPSCLFKIFQTNTQYINYNMIENDILTVQFFDKPIDYATHEIPIAEVTIVFPPTDKPLNIAQWKLLVNDKYASTNINIGENTLLLNNILNYDWTFYPYHVSYLTNKVQYIKSVLVKNTNKSNYYIRLLGKWPLLQFFGKPIDADTLGMEKMNSNTMNNNTMNNNTMDNNTMNNNTMNNNTMNNMTNMFPNNKNACIQTMFPQYATSDPNNPITTFDNMAELIIVPNSIYYGSIDGFMNDAIMNFSTKKDATEKWIYHNLDTQDTHPFHFHLTSGFVQVPDDPTPISNILYNPQIYAKDTYSIPSQQSIAFFIKFSNYQSSDIGAPDQSINIKYLGYMYHCHYMTHHDMNMMGQYFVYQNYHDYF